MGMCGYIMGLLHKRMPIRDIQVDSSAVCIGTVESGQIYVHMWAGWCY